MTDLIKPPHAISIWASKEILYVELPQADSGGGQSHFLKLPLNTYGLNKCLSILKARSEASKIATKGDPTQGQADEAIKQMQRAAAGYKGPIKKEVKVPISQELKNNVKDVIRRFIKI